MNRKLSNSHKQINDHQQITMLLATKDVQGLRRLLSVALRNGASLPTILNQMQCSIDGIYSPKGKFSERELAIGFLAKSLGGPRLLYALSIPLCQLWQRNIMFHVLSSQFLCLHTRKFLTTSETSLVLVENQVLPCCLHESHFLDIFL